LDAGIPLPGTAAEFPVNSAAGEAALSDGRRKVRYKMKTLKLGVILIALSMIAAIGTTTWGDPPEILPEEALHVVNGSLYNADGETVGHMQVSWTKHCDLTYGEIICAEVKVKLDKVQPNTTYQGWLFVQIAGVCHRGSDYVTIETNPGGAGTIQFLGYCCVAPEQFPTCVLIRLSSADEDIESEHIALTR